MGSVIINPLCLKECNDHLYQTPRADQLAGNNTLAYTGCIFMHLQERCFVTTVLSVGWWLSHAQVAFRRVGEQPIFHDHLDWLCEKTRLQQDDNVSVLCSDVTAKLIWWYSQQAFSKQQNTLLPTLNSSINLISRSRRLAINSLSHFNYLTVPFVFIMSGGISL